jgi:hypothetical protein
LGNGTALCIANAMDMVNNQIMMHARGTSEVRQILELVIVQTSSSTPLFIGFRCHASQQIRD